MRATYTLLLLGSIMAVMALDWRWRLALWAHAAHTARVIGVGVAMFVIWDLAGISLHIFYPGSSPYVFNLQVLPGFPVEEVLFLTLLCYTALIISRWQARL
jgi:lycopene cyclase domain-containing protein